MNFRRILAAVSLLALATMAGLSAQSATGAAAPGKASISAKGVVKGKQVLIGGYSPRCSKGRYQLQVKVNRAGKAVRGQVSGRCEGGRTPWQATLNSRSGSLGAGVAWVDVVAMVRQGKKTISTKHSFRKIKLVNYTPLKGGWSFGDITFDVEPGVHVQIIGGGAGTSNCTRDETVTSFHTTSRPFKQQIAIYAKGDGSCWNERSWSSFKLIVTREDGKRGTGRVTQGEFEGDPPFLGYGLDCRSDWYSVHKEMDGLKCERTGRYDVKISWS